MFSYFFCDGMKLIQDVIRLPLALLYVAVIMGLWLVILSEKPSITSRVVGQQIAKTSFNRVSTVTLNSRSLSAMKVAMERNHRKQKAIVVPLAIRSSCVQVIQNTTQRSMSQTAWKWAVLLDILIRCYTNQMQKSSALQCVTRR